MMHRNRSLFDVERRTACARKAQLALLAAAMLSFVLPAAAQSPVAFPGAYGFGATATGGRGGTVVHVTNLNDSGPGSFRDAVSQPNRIVVFDVGGYIVLQSPVSLSSNLTIAGQTAPGQGIGIMAGEISASGKSNIIIRNVRMRQGNQDPQTGKSAFNMGTGSNIILDHCSFEYGQWDSVDAVGTLNFTVQNSIIANPLYQQFGAHVEKGPSTFYRNLWVNAHNRQPLSKDNTVYINNVIYDYELGYTSGNTGGIFSHDIVNNYFIAGPETTTPSDAFFQMNANQSVYAVGNYIDASPDGVLNGTLNNTVDASLVLNAPWSATTTSIPTLSAADAVRYDTASSGAFPRDAVDQFAVDATLSLGLSGELYKDQALTGLPNDGYGTLNGGTPLPGTTTDGIADYWAQANGLSTTDPTVASATFGTSGYSNLEAYLNSLVLPDLWSSADLTTSPIQGASTYNALTGAWVLAGSGQNTGMGFDQAQFASQAWSTSGSLTAQILAINGSMGGKAGLLVRADANANAAFVAFVMDSSGTVSLLSRVADDAASTGVQQSGFGFGTLLRLVRNGNSFAAYTSTNGTTWSFFGMASIPTGSSTRAGLAVSSADGSLASATLQQVAFSTDTGSTVTVQPSTTTLVYPASLNLTIPVTPEESQPGTPTGSVTILDGTTRLTTQPLQGGGTAYWYLTPSLHVGSHQLLAAYSGDGTHSPGLSAPVTITVTAAQTNLSASCWNASFPYGGNYNCTVQVSAGAAGNAKGSITYTLDGTASTVPLNANGGAQFVIPTPAVGGHSLTIGFPAQGDFAASNTVSESFTVTPATTY